jgi:hypothetical protein
VHETLDKNELEEEQTEVKKSNKTRKCGRKAGGYFFSSRPLYRVLTFVAKGKDEMKKKTIEKEKKTIDSSRYFLHVSSTTLLQL